MKNVEAALREFAEFVAEHDRSATCVADLDAGTWRPTSGGWPSDLRHAVVRCTDTS